jgi:phospho-N-acetylmuramoyl-pentapeptide-transferase
MKREIKMNILYICLAAVISFGITAAIGVWMIPFLHKLKFGQTIRDIGPSWHKKKQGTPTMGGLMFIIGSTAAILMFMPFIISGGNEVMLISVRAIAGFVMALAFGFTGFMDDYISIKNHRNLGLNEKQKLVLQFAIAAAYLVTVRMAGGSTTTFFPFAGRVNLGFMYYVLALVVIVGENNAVNFTDGIDGLNGTVTAVYCASMLVCATILNCTSISLIAAAVMGACIGFLIWNFNPAKVFMGDTGALFLGGIVCTLAFGIDMPILLLPAGIIYIIEILSVVIQVLYFKATHGKRFFKMTPIHHHFEMSGWSEKKICTVFGIISAIGGVISVLLVKYGV